MKINKRLLPLKIHFFFLLGCQSPIIPFLVVVAAQLGIPVSVQGSVFAGLLLFTILTKPVIAAVADSFPKYRKAIFMTTLLFLIGGYGSICFIPPLKETPVLKGQFIRASDKPQVLSNPQVSDGSSNSEDFSSQPMLLAYNDESCYIKIAWDCLPTCSDPWKCITGNNTDTNIIAKKVDGKNMFQTKKDPSNTFSDHLFEVKDLESTDEIWNISKEMTFSITAGHLYKLEGVNISWDFLDQNISLECTRADWIGNSCKPVFRYWEFWIYVLLLTIGRVSSSTVSSFTDAITVDSTGGNSAAYGSQRAWGTVGWGLMGPVSGLLVDLWSGSSVTKDYTPAFLILFVLGTMDFITCASSLKVPQIGKNTNVMKEVGPLLRQPRFFLFCCFVFINGMFHAIVVNFLFLMQEEMALGTSAMRYMKFLQGFTLFIHCSIEAPFMFLFGWFMKKLGAQRVLSLVFFLFIFRFLGLSIVGFYGPVWATIMVEVLSGPCYGLGYTAVVVYAATISPPGTSTTVQSIVNICYSSFGYALASFIGGIMFEVFGGPTMYTIMWIASCIVFILHLLSLKFLPPPEEAAGRKTEPEKEVGMAIENTVENMPFREKEDLDKRHLGEAEFVANEEETTPMTPNEEETTPMTPNGEETTPITAR